MPISRDGETLAPGFEFRSSFRRRLISGAAAAAAAVAPETSAQMTLVSAENSVTESVSGDTCSDSDSMVMDGGGKEKRTGKVRVNGGGGKRGDGTETATKDVFRASAPAHRRVKESPLSSDAIFKQSHAGLFNLCIVVLVAVNSRLIIENLMKYGLLIRAGFWFSSRSLKDWPLLMCCITLHFFPLAAFVVEKLAWKKLISEPVVLFFHVIIVMTEIIYPVFVIMRCDSAVLSGLTLMLIASIIWLKLISFIHTNYDFRTLCYPIAKDEIPSEGLSFDYSDDVNFQSLVYFMVAPTLCYQPSYPRTACIRRGWVIRQSIKLAVFTGFMGFIIEQYINPIVKNSEHPLKGNFLNAIERVLKLSVPNLYVWLCMFYCFFHLWLNILAELLRFGDREFYKDWWNAKTIEEYWRMWNMPVHKWMVRHIYFPCIRNGLPKPEAAFDSPSRACWGRDRKHPARTIGWCSGDQLKNRRFTPFKNSRSSPAPFCCIQTTYFHSGWTGKEGERRVKRSLNGVAILISFFISAIFHELCIAVPCRTFKFWAFFGILFQVPLGILTRFLQNKFQNSMVGNMIFWVFFSILGQPMCVLLYYHDVMNRKASTE